MPSNSSVSLIVGDVLETLQTFEANSFDGCFCDPPYGLNFMGAAWDKGVPSSTVWAEVLRVLKPGGPLLSFGGTKTWHRTAVAIEDGGFEIRDTLMWLYGSGFPKSKSSFRPCWEPVIAAIKPVESSYVYNAATYGVAGFNIQSSRTDEGRWPGNLIVDSGFTQDWARYFYHPKVNRTEREAGCESLPLRLAGGMSGTKDKSLKTGSGNERNNLAHNNHPCLKPIALTRYLSQLTLPPQRESSPRRLLVPFCGSGSEMIGGLLAGWEQVTGIDKEPGFIEIAAARLEHWSNKQLCQ